MRMNNTSDTSSGLCGQITSKTVYTEQTKSSTVKTCVRKIQPSRTRQGAMDQQNIVLRIQVDYAAGHDLARSARQLPAWLTRELRKGNNGARRELGKG